NVLAIGNLAVAHTSVKANKGRDARAQIGEWAGQTGLVCRCNSFAYGVCVFVTFDQSELRIRIRPFRSRHTVDATFTRLSGSSTQRTGTKTTRQPPFAARRRSSVSQNQPLSSI